MLTGTLGGETPAGSVLGLAHLLRDGPAAADFRILFPPDVSPAHTRVHAHTPISRDTHVWNTCIACVNICLNMDEHAHVYSMHLTRIRQLGHKFDFSLDFAGVHN